ncbi:hypothetical protein ACHHYP_14150 [Achlya hypogyna]|uniref:Uncharacterized protein n=1 Tax=Achlya hypogyna TaxID=1202772 RepID=A0A1V9YDS6_ACHHY|nr:hypothetical protein ACHHYP_14150 [Achlya hypogyna]
MNEFDICAPPSPLLKLYPPPPVSPPNGQPKMLLGGALLRKSTPLAVFENLGDDAMAYKTPTTKMRFIDTLRYHKPTPEERAEYNLAGSTERLYLHTLNDVLAICRARRGMRFNGHQICQIRAITNELHTSYDVLNAMFKALPPGVNRYKPSAEVPKDADEKLLMDAAVSFHEQANAYVAIFLRLRSVVTCIKATQPPPTTVLDTSETDTEFESKANAPFPHFLLVLIQMYRRERMTVPSLASGPALPAQPWSPSDTSPPLDSLAQFAIFLASGLVHQFPFHKDELESIAVLLQVMYDPCRCIGLCLTLVSYHNSKCDHEADASRLQIDLRDADVTEHALRTSLFEFLTTVRELRAIPKQTELLAKKRKVMSK